MYTAFIDISQTELRSSFEKGAYVMLECNEHMSGCWHEAGVFVGKEDLPCSKD